MNSRDNSSTTMSSCKAKVITLHSRLSCLARGAGAGRGVEIHGDVCDPG